MTLTRRRPDGSAREHQHRRRFELRADARGAGARAPAVALRRALAGAGRTAGSPRWARPVTRAARGRRPSWLRGRSRRDRPRPRHRRGADAAGSAVRPRLHHRRRMLLDRLKGDDAGGQRSRRACSTRPRRCSCSTTRGSCRRRWSRAAIEDVRAFQRRHGAVVVKPLHGNGGKAIFKVEADGDQPLGDDRGVRPGLARAVHGPAVPPRGRRGRQAHRAGRRRVRRGDQPQAGRGRVPLQPRAGRLCRGDRR